MKTKVTIIIALIASVALLSGCMAPDTTTHLHLNPMTGDMNWSNPKDTSIQSLEAGVGTNGVHYIKLSNFSTLNNPAVISAAGTAQANSITATGTAATQIISALGSAAGTVAGTAAGAAITGK